jgi:hypothetical protein
MHGLYIGNLYAHFLGCTPIVFIMLRQAIRRPVAKADLSVFERYASRVRVVGHLSESFWMRRCVVHAIMGISSRSLLVPKLRALSCAIRAPDLRSCVRYLLGLNLVCLYLSLGRAQEDFWSTIISSVLSGLDRHSPRLKVFRLCNAPSQASELALLWTPAPAGGRTCLAQ